MKKVFALFLLTILFASCHGTFTGYVVCKEYTPAYIGTEQPKTEQQAMIGAGAAVAANTNMKRHEFHPATFVIYVANKDKVESLYIDSIEYLKIKVPQKYTYKY